MKSPFPGMDPYLERHWLDLHARLVVYACDALQPRLPGDLRARVEERITVEPLDGHGPARGYKPDVRVIERGGPRRPAAPAEAGIAVAEPVIVYRDEAPTEGFIKIVDVGSGHRVVTVIEILSLSNKRPGNDQDKYIQKRDELIDGGVSFVEIDLLRAGQFILAAPKSKIPASHRTNYQVCVSRGWRLIEIEVYAVPLRAPLPTIGVPLRKSDADVPLDLQKLVDQCYANGGYDDIDYRAEPDPPLEPDDAAWADALLRERGLR
jgi:hypothetical protein